MTGDLHVSEAVADIVVAVGTVRGGERAAPEAGLEVRTAFSGPAVRKNVVGREGSAAAVVVVERVWVVGGVEPEGVVAVAAVGAVVEVVAVLEVRIAGSVPEPADAGAYLNWAVRYTWSGSACKSSHSAGAGGWRGELVADVGSAVKLGLSWTCGCCS